MNGTDRVELLLGLDRPEEALATAGRLLASSPDDADLHVLAGRALDRLGRTEEALAASGRALAQRPEDPDALMLRAFVLVDLERLDDAETTLRTLLAQDPGHAYAHLALGLCLLAQQRLDEAWESVTRARSLAPDDADTHHAAGLVADCLPDLDGAACYRQALAVDPHHTAARHELMRAEPGSLREHARTLADLLRTDPHDEEYRRSVQDWADRTARRSLLGAVGAVAVAGFVGAGGLAAVLLMLLWWRRLRADVPPSIRAEVRRRLPRTPYLLLTWATTVVTALAAVVLTFAPEPRPLGWTLLPWLLVPWLLVPVWGALRWLRAPLWLTPRLVRALFS